MTDPPPRTAQTDGLFWWIISVLAVAYLGLRFVLPRVSVWLGSSPVPAPVPAFAMWIYMLCAVFGSLVYVSSDDRRWQAFLTPVVRLLAVQRGPDRKMRIVILTMVPLLVGWLTWQRISPAPDVPTEIRLQHPTQPASYASMVNPHDRLTTGGDDERAATVLYQKNCRPCHGASAAGNGPLARGFRLRPVDFTDAGTIASVIESYPFWRIREGHSGLPDIATPWNSAMPAWQEELSDDDIWRIILAEYRLSGTEPRNPEGVRP